MPKYLLVILIHFLFCITLASQNQRCQASLDSAGVWEIANKHGIKRDLQSTFPKSLVFDTLSCKWIASAFRVSHSNRGKCKYTNGCTVVVCTSIYIDDRTKKVSRKHRKKTVYPNYE